MTTLPFTWYGPPGKKGPVRVTEAAPDVVQLRVTGAPEAVENTGSFVKVRIWTEPTVKVALAVTEPAALVAVKTYVVVTVGLTVWHPVAATVPMPGAMLTVVAPCTCQQSCD